MSETMYTEFEAEIAKSEYQRTRITIAALLLGFLIYIINYFLLDEQDVNIVFGSASNYFFTGCVMVAFILYELIVLKLIYKAVNGKHRISNTFKVIHALIEVSFPSLLMVYVVNLQSEALVTESPIPFLYFLFIILSVLHLDFRISILTGVVAAIEYGMIINYTFSLTDILSGMPVITFYTRCALLVICGGAAGFVSEELKQRITNSFELQQSKNDIEKLFGQHVSKEVFMAILEDQSVAKKVEATVLALDIRNFTAFAENRDPQEIMEYQNKIFGPIIDIINQHQGVVNQIMGDGIMATFGTPLINALHADMAFQASLKIIEKMRELIATGFIPETRIGIGLHTGEVITGNIGNESRKQYSISGTAVITAFRVEQLNKEIHSQMLITEEVHRRIEPGAVKLTHLGARSIRGFGKTVEIYHVNI